MLYLYLENNLTNEKKEKIMEGITSIRGRKLDIQAKSQVYLYT